MAASSLLRPEDLAETRAGPLDPEKNFPSRAILNGEVVHVADWEAEDVPEFEKLVARKHGIKSGVIVPLRRKDEGIGALAVVRESAGPYHEKEIALLQSFADQAVIAIENVRLFNETKEALEQQTAISEVLRVISNSPADVSPVLQAVAERAMRICEATDARIYLVDGSQLRHAAGVGDVPSLEIGALRPIERGFVMGRSVIDGKPVHVEDIQAQPEEFPHSTSRQRGARTVLAVPLMREKRALGAILLRRLELRPFTEKQIALLKRTCACSTRRRNRSTSRRPRPTCSR
jgi:GAF domain-containing protein